MVGTVTDTSGAVVPDTAVGITHKETGVTRSTTTNEAGVYRFDGRVYSLKITKPGFKPFLSTEVVVEANRATTMDVRLEVGAVETVIAVNAESAALLVKDAPLRGGNFKPQEVSRLPLGSLEPIALARTLPGVELPAGSTVFGRRTEATGFSVNGQRPRGNNYLLDGTDNNDMTFGGTAQSFNIADAVQELSVQTSNFGVEFGRAGGGVFNVITKSGTNSYHGTGFWRYGSQVFNSISNTDKLNGAPQSVFSDNTYGFTLGGPFRKNKTFFFGAFQQETYRSTRIYTFKVPTSDAVTKLRLLFPSNPRLDLYLDALGDLRGSANSHPLALGMGRGEIMVGSAPVGIPATNDGPQWMARLDHSLSEAHRLSLRYTYDSRTASPGPEDLGVGIPGGVGFPGYMIDQNGRDQNFLFTDNYTPRLTWTNEFRFSYARVGNNWPGAISPRSVPLASSMPQIDIPNIDTPGIKGNYPQFRFVNKWLFQETQSKLAGRHFFRYGAEFLWQFAEERGVGFLDRGLLRYTNSTSTGFSSFANFLDDFSGPSGQAERTFGSPVFYPDQFRESYFFQDTWKGSPSLALTLGLRYENFGQPANAFKFPAFAGFDPGKFLVPNKVNHDNSNFGPALGLAWSPAYRSGLLGQLFGQGKTVWRGGFQISYDAFFTQMLGAMAAATPNGEDVVVNAPNIGRGTPGWFAQLPTVPGPPRLSDAQTFVFDKNVRNPYTERWSLGFQRELPDKILLDLSYVGSASHKLFTREDINPRQLNGLRLHPDFGPRIIIASEGNSAYHSLQWRVERRLAKSFQVTGSYTWSRNLDSTGEVLMTNLNSGNNNYTSLPISQGGLKIDRGLSDYHRKHRLSIAHLWDIPGPNHGIWKQAFGGWLLTGIISFQSGAPFSLQNGFDRNNDGLANDRPDIGNPDAPLNTRAVVSVTGPGACATGYRNPDTGGCATPADVHFVQGQGLPNRSTVGRNTLFTGGINNWDMSFFKTFAVTETKKLEFRWEAFNAFNHPQFVNVPERNVVSSPPGSFLNPDFTNSGIRTMQMQLKIIF